MFGLKKNVHSFQERMCMNGVTLSTGGFSRESDHLVCVLFCVPSEEKR